MGSVDAVRKLAYPERGFSILAAVSPKKPPNRIESEAQQSVASQLALARQEMAEASGFIVNTEA